MYYNYNNDVFECVITALVCLQGILLLIGLIPNFIEGPYKYIDLDGNYGRARICKTYNKVLICKDKNGKEIEVISYK